jgi:hypothetical protein
MEAWKALQHFRNPNPTKTNVTGKDSVTVRFVTVTKYISQEKICFLRRFHVFLLFFCVFCSRRLHFLGQVAHRCIVMADFDSFPRTTKRATPTGPEFATFAPHSGMEKLTSSCCCRASCTILAMLQDCGQHGQDECFPTPNNQISNKDRRKWRSKTKQNNTQQPDFK